jgi:hypothetical protein
VPASAEDVFDEVQSAGPGDHDDEGDERNRDRTHSENFLAFVQSSVAGVKIVSRFTDRGLTPAFAAPPVILRNASGGERRNHAHEGDERHRRGT